ncbi:MAG TPA: DUF2520 domain-containing protein [Candidatus Avimuribaculum pullicola]|nr:DUF2520 domain-containing protein [Candidatus Avimuribaculum pullicola]
MEATGMKAVIIGAGNVATNLAHALLAAGIDVAQVYSHTMAHAEELAVKVKAAATANLANITADADIYIISVKDDAIADVANAVPDNGALWVHTSGSVPMTVLETSHCRCGVFYPMQSFSKQTLTDFHEVPFFIEGNSENTAAEIETVASKLSHRVFRASSEQRKQLHIAAVFACNFANHMWTLASDVLNKAGLPFDVMLPLITTTADKLKLLTPAESQTGPAIRHDHHVMQSHEAMLDDNMRTIYHILSQNIMKRHE